jgi:hypothetical protein
MCMLNHMVNHVICKMLKKFLVLFCSRYISECFGTLATLSFEEKKCYNNGEFYRIDV